MSSFVANTLQELMGILCLYFVTESCMDWFRVIYGLVSFSAKGVEQKRNVTSS